MGCHSVAVGSPREVKSATSGKTELALPTLAIAEVPVAELPVRDRLLLWENSQLVKFRVEHEATPKNEDKNDTEQSAVTDPCVGGVLIEKCYSTVRLSYVHCTTGWTLFMLVESREFLAPHTCLHAKAL